MKNCKRLVAVVLTVLLVAACFAGCGKTTQRDEALLGVWVTEQELPMELDADLSLEMCLEFQADGKMKLYVTDEAIQNVSVETYEAIFGQYSEEEILAALKEEGFETPEDCVNFLIEELQEMCGGVQMEAIWTTENGVITSYETEEDFKNGKPSPDGTDSYKVSADGKTLTLDVGTPEELVFHKG